MPTYERSPEFDRLFAALSDAQRRAFRRAAGRFVEDLDRDGNFRNGLRVKGIRGAPGMFEMTWSGDGRAVFSYGNSIREGEPHIIWHAIGGHEILP